MLEDLAKLAATVLVTGLVTGLVTWFLASLRFTAKLGDHRREIELSLREEAASRMLAMRELERALGEARQELYDELREVKTQQRQLEERAAQFREQSSHDFAKEANVARDLLEFTDLCQRILHTVGVLEGFMRQQGMALGPGLDSPTTRSRSRR